MEIEVYVSVFDQRLQHRLQCVAGIHGAVAVVDVIGHIAAGRPGEQHRGDIDAGVVNDLSETIDGFLETGVEAVNEDEDPPSRYPFDACIEIGLRLSQVHAIGAQDGEVPFRIGRQTRTEARRLPAGARQPGESTRRCRRNLALVPSILRT